MGVGIGLLVFAISVILESKKVRGAYVFFIIIQDLLLVLASDLILLMQPFSFSFVGKLIVEVVAFIFLKFEQTVNAPKENVWQEISQVKDYHKVAPNIDKVKILSGNGRYMCRSCSLGKNNGPKPAPFGMKAQNFPLKWILNRRITLIHLNTLWEPGK